MTISRRATLQLLTSSRASRNNSAHIIFTFRSSVVTLRPESVSDISDGRIQSLTQGQPAHMPRHKLVSLLLGTIWLFGLAPVESSGETIGLSLSSLSLGTSPPLLAQKKGFYSQEGLDVQIAVVESGTRAIQALLGGSVQLASTGPEDFIRATEAGTPMVILAGVLGSLTHSLVAGPAVKSIGELRGGKIAVSGLTGSVTYALKHILAKNNLHYPKDYLMIQIGGVSVRWAALKSGGIDATLIAEPLTLVAEESGLSNLGYVGDYIPHLQVTAVAAKSDWAKANRGLVVRYLKGLVRTYQWLYNNRDEAIEATAAVAKVERKFAARGYEIYTKRRVWPIDGSPAMDGMKVVLDYMREGKMLASSAGTEKYVDLSYLEQAKRELGIR
jgi:NitT/TauT family transport system substrate-binding protein